MKPASTRAKARRLLAQNRRRIDAFCRALDVNPEALTRLTTALQHNPEALAQLHAVLAKLLAGSARARGRVLRAMARCAGAHATAVQLGSRRRRSRRHGVTTNTRRVGRTGRESGGSANRRANERRIARHFDAVFIGNCGTGDEQRVKLSNGALALAVRLQYSTAVR